VRRAGWARTSVLVAVIGVAAAGCGSSTNPGGTSPQTTAASATTAGSPAASGPTLTIKSFTFSPNPLKAKVGDTVTVTNLDGTNHTVTALDGSFDTGPFSSGSKTFQLTKAGTFNFHCNIHNFMTGVIQVSS
jgi:plastocyanin